MGPTPSGGVCCDKVEIDLETQSKQRGCCWQSLRHSSAVLVCPLDFLLHFLSDDAPHFMLTPMAALPHVRSAKCKGWKYANKRCMLGCSNWILSSMHNSKDEIFVKKEYVTTVLRQKIMPKMRYLRHIAYMVWIEIKPMKRSCFSHYFNICTECYTISAYISRSVNEITQNLRKLLRKYKEFHAVF